MELSKLAQQETCAVRAQGRMTHLQRAIATSQCQAMCHCMRAPSALPSVEMCWARKLSRYCVRRSCISKTPLWSNCGTCIALRVCKVRRQCSPVPKPRLACIGIDWIQPVASSVVRSRRLYMPRPWTALSLSTRCQLRCVGTRHRLRLLQRRAESHQHLRLHMRQAANCGLRAGQATTAPIMLQCLWQPHQVTSRQCKACNRRQTLAVCPNRAIFHLLQVCVRP